MQQPGRMLHMLAAFSLLLCAALVALWVRSRSTADEITLRTPYHETSLVSGAGSLWLRHGSLDFATPQYMLDQGTSVSPPSPEWSVVRQTEAAENLPDQIIRNDPAAPSPARVPIRVSRGTPPVWWSESPPFWSGWQVMIPDWVLMLVMAAAPGFWVVAKWRAGPSRRAGRCRTCDYDLRATPDRCPECGTRVSRT